MNTPKKHTSTVTTVLITLFICLISTLKSHAASDTNQILKIINHKISNEKMGLGVAVVVIDGDKTEFFSIGESHIESKRKVNNKTLFEIGSITKTFTATALASMVIEGKVKLDDPVQMYLPKNVQLPIKNNKPITLLSLANHSSGLPRLPTNMPVKNQLDPYADYSIELMYKFLNNHQLEYEVGTKQEYSNLGMGLLGHVLALIDNKSYQDMLTSRVLKPLTMKNTFVTVPSNQTNHLSNGHNGELKPTPLWNLNSLSGAGSIKSNIQDMAIFLKRNMDKKQLNEALSLAQTSSFEFQGNNTGLAWIISPSKNGEIFMHDGATGGFSSFIGFNKTTNKGIVILTNTAFNMNDVGYHYLNNSLDSIRLVTPQRIKLSNEQLNKLNGKFALTPEFVLSITNEENQLFVQATGQQKLPLAAISSTEFVNNKVKVKIAFEVDSNNTALSLTMYQGGQTLPAKKL